MNTYLIVLTDIAIKCLLRFSGHQLSKQVIWILACALTQWRSLLADMFNFETKKMNITQK